MDSDTTKSQTTAPAVDPSQKYIRTYAGDMEIAQKGGKPDLAPLVAQTAPPVVVKKSAPAQVPPPAPPIVVERPIERPVPTPIPPAPAAAPSPLHTYSDDFADKIKAEHASTTTVLAAEQDAAPLTVDEPEIPEKHRLAYAIAGVLLLVLGGSGAYYAYTQYAISHAPVIVEQKATAPIFVDEQEEISGEGTALWASVSQSVSRPLAPGTVRLLYSANATTTRNSIFVTMQPPAPDILTRNIIGAGSMVGVINIGNSQSAFFILDVSTYNDTFAGMLSWERTMIKDLASLFPAYPPPLVLATTTVPISPIATTTATTTTATTTKKKTGKNATASPPVPPETEVVFLTPPPPPFFATFHDEITANHDVRIYRDAFNQSILLYGYWNQSILVIARDPKAFAEIISRLATSHTQS